MRPRINPAVARKAADLVASINFRQTDTRKYPLKTLPPPKGRATHVVITECDLPNSDWPPHDVIVDHQGMLWFSDFGDQRLGETDPKTGKVTTDPIPFMKPDEPKGCLEVEEDPHGDIWEAMRKAPPRPLGRQQSRRRDHQGRAAGLIGNGALLEHGQGALQRAALMCQ